MLGMGVVPGEEGMVAEAAKVVVGSRHLGLGSHQCLSNQLKIHNAWGHQFFLCSTIPMDSWLVLWLLLRLQLSLWTEREGLKKSEWSLFWLIGTDNGAHTVSEFRASHRAHAQTL
jgi:hypothetical protein